MMKESPKLGITQKMVKRTEENFIPLEENPIDFIDNVLKRIPSEQPVLNRYLDFAEKQFRVKNPIAYRLGAAFAYDMLPEEHRTQALTRTQINVVQKSLVEHLVSEVDQARNRKGHIDISWCIDKLNKDSPAFIAWLEVELEDFKDEHTKVAFTLGALIVALPFYMKGEAQELERTLFGSAP